MDVLLAHNLQIQTVAEGIETEEQAIALRDLGCELEQGYYFWQTRAASLAAQTLENFLA